MSAYAARPILVVDDEELLRSAMRRLLEHLGHVIVEAADGREALALLQDEPLPALMILDLRMPGMSGEALLFLYSRVWPSKGQPNKVSEY